MPGGIPRPAGSGICAGEFQEEVRWRSQPLVHCPAPGARHSPGQRPVRHRGAGDAAALVAGDKTEVQTTPAGLCRRHTCLHAGRKPKRGYIHFHGRLPAPALQPGDQCPENRLRTVRIGHDGNLRLAVRGRVFDRLASESTGVHGPDNGDYPPARENGPGFLL
ncbi:hypothetical protein M138_4839 [Bacteroides fragilis str. S23L17]|nr:hypothetical protein M138_4839 [Bacteroides fragilis str. S23L17]